jgi:beta-N-acetylhexosaminidase
MLYRKILPLLIPLLIVFGSHIPVTAAQNLKATGEKRQLLLSDQIDNVLNHLSLEQKVGQLFIVAADGNFDNLTELIRSFHIGGFIFFARHAATLNETMNRVELLKNTSAIVPFIAVDQEGGRVTRLSFTTPVPSPCSLAGLSPATLRNIGRLLGHELQLIGFNLNFAPVMDVATRPDNSVIGDRSFSNDPYKVALLGNAFIKGLQQNGIAAVAKHFPGHGDTRADSHLELPIVTLSADRLDAVEILPFRAAVQAEVAMIMMAHVHYPGLDSKPLQPASLSKPIITDLLRQELQYNGIIITDAMNMKAITNSLTSRQAAIAALKSGADIILMPQNFPDAYHAVLTAVKQGEIPLSQIDDSLRRILQIKLRFPSENRQISFQTRLNYALANVGSAKHRNLMFALLKDISVSDDMATW